MRWYWPVPTTWGRYCDRLSTTRAEATSTLARACASDGWERKARSIAASSIMVSLAGPATASLQKAQIARRLTAESARDKRSLDRFMASKHTTEPDLASDLRPALRVSQMGRQNMRCAIAETVPGKKMSI